MATLIWRRMITSLWATNPPEAWIIWHWWLVQMLVKQRLKQVELCGARRVKEMSNQSSAPRSWHAFSLPQLFQIFSDARLVSLPLFLLCLWIQLHIGSFCDSVMPTLLYCICYSGNAAWSVLLVCFSSSVSAPDSLTEANLTAFYKKKIEMIDWPIEQGLHFMVLFPMSCSYWNMLCWAQTPTIHKAAMLE